MNEIDLIKKEISNVKDILHNLLNILPSFNITDEKILPYGLKQHTRSVSWIVEQVINQQMKFNTAKLGLDFVNYDMADTCLHDCEIELNGQKFYINIKTHNITGKNNKNDIAAVEKIYYQYHANCQYTQYGTFMASTTFIPQSGPPQTLNKEIRVVP